MCLVQYITYAIVIDYFTIPFELNWLATWSGKLVCCSMFVCLFVCLFFISKFISKLLYNLFLFSNIYRFDGQSITWDLVTRNSNIWKLSMPCFKQIQHYFWILFFECDSATKVGCYCFLRWLFFQPRFLFKMSDWHCNRKVWIDMYHAVSILVMFLVSNNNNEC